MSRHHAEAGWASISAAARPLLEAALPLPCIQGCGRMVEPGQAFDIAHRVDLARHGDVNDYGVAHRGCNRSAGGRLGAAMMNGRRRTRSRRLAW